MYTIRGARRRLAKMFRETHPWVKGHHIEVAIHNDGSFTGWIKQRILDKRESREELVAR
jgi:hypothetical protein